MSNRLYNELVGQWVIVRASSTDEPWFGILRDKEGAGVVLRRAQRLYEWCPKTSFSLSAVAMHGIDWRKSKIAPEVFSVWLEATEIIPCSSDAISSISGAPKAIRPSAEDTQGDEE